MPLTSRLKRLTERLRPTRVGALAAGATAAVARAVPHPEPAREPQVRPDPGAATAPEIPPGLVVASGYAWRFLLLGVFLVAVYQVLAYFSAVTVPVAMAILIAALLHPLVTRLRLWGARPAVAALVALLGMLLFIVGVLTAVGAQVVAQWPELVEQTVTGVEGLLLWLASGPLHIDQAQLNEWFDLGRTWIQESAAQLAGMAASIGAAFGSFMAGLATALITSFFFAYQGRTIFSSALDVLVPRRYRVDTERAALRGWNSLVAYMRSAVTVAAVDAVGVGLVAWALGMPLVAALFALTFFASFIPIVGAVAAGAVAVLVALVTQGWVSGLIMLAGVVVVQQAESNFLQPFLMSKAVDIHPLGVLIGLTAGAVVGGILGALLSIPITAFVVAFVRALRHPGEPITESEGEGVAHPEAAPS